MENDMDTETEKALSDIEESGFFLDEIETIIEPVVYPEIKNINHPCYLKPLDNWNVNNFIEQMRRFQT